MRTLKNWQHFPKQLTSKYSRIANMINIENETGRNIVHKNLNMNKVCAKMVPKISVKTRRTIVKTFALTS